MKIAQVAPLIESVPPKLYGGTERVVAYLTERGISSERLSAIGAGSDAPIASNDNATGRQVNRRIEFELSHREAKKGRRLFAL